MSAQDRYYQFSAQQAHVRGETFSFFTRPALSEWKEWGISAILLAEQARLSSQAHILHMHCGSGLVGAVAARMASDGHVTLLDCNGAAVQAARLTLEANGIGNAEVILSDCAQAVYGRTFDNVLALLPKGRAVWEQTILDAAAVLHVGGDLYLAGANNSGIKTAAKFMERILGNVDVLAYKGGCRVLRTRKKEPVSLPDSDYYTWRHASAQVGDQQLAYVTKPGLFSWEQLDAGTHLLIEALVAHPLHPHDRVLDIGCGSGVLTVVAGRQAHAGHVVGVDVDCRAVEATRRTLDLNQIGNGEALLSDGAEAVRGRTFSVVVTNPPFHQERATHYAVAEQIIRDAARLLEPGGRLYLVANAFLKYEPIIESEFGAVKVLRRTSSFKVLHGLKKR